MLFIAVAIAVPDTTVWDPSGVSQHRCRAEGKSDREHQDSHLLLHWTPLTILFTIFMTRIEYDL